MFRGQNYPLYARWRIRRWRRSRIAHSPQASLGCESLGHILGEIPKRPIETLILIDAVDGT
jgi:hypothetical protein